MSILTAQAWAADFVDSAVLAYRVYSSNACRAAMELDVVTNNSAL